MIDVILVICAVVIFVFELIICGGLIEVEERLNETEKRLDSRVRDLAKQKDPDVEILYRAVQKLAFAVAAMKDEEKGE